jgi:hypothetical protein
MPKVSLSGFGFTVGDRVELLEVHHKEYRGRLGTVEGANVARKAIRVQLDPPAGHYEAEPENLRKLQEEPDQGFVAWHTATQPTRVHLCQEAGLHASMAKPDWGRLPGWVQKKIRATTRARRGGDQPEEPAPMPDPIRDRAGNSLLVCPECGGHLQASTKVYLNISPNGILGTSGLNDAEITYYCENDHPADPGLVQRIEAATNAQWLALRNRLEANLAVAPGPVNDCEACCDMPGDVSGGLRGINLGFEEPTSPQRKALFEAFKTHFEENGTESAEDIDVVVRRNYITGGPGWSGDLYLVVWDGDPAFTDTFGITHDGEWTHWAGPTIPNNANPALEAFDRTLAVCALLAVHKDAHALGLIAKGLKWQDSTPELSQSLRSLADRLNVET